MISINPLASGIPPEDAARLIREAMNVDAAIVITIDPARRPPLIATGDGCDEAVDGEIRKMAGMCERVLTAYFLTHTGADVLDFDELNDEAKGGDECEP